MLQSINFVELPASPAQVWSVLTDLAEYRIWHPAVWMTGTASEDAVVGYGFKKFADLLNAPIAVRVFDYEPCRSIGWRFGSQLLMRVKEWYALTPTAAGTRVEHGANCVGLLSRIAQPVFVQDVCGFLQEADVALAQHLHRLK